MVEGIPTIDPGTKVPSSGPLDADLMIIGEAPGGEEEKAGQPFVGPAGQLLRSFLMEVGIDPTRVYYANLTGVRPPGNKLEKFFLDGGVPNSIVAEGLMDLAQEIKRVNPKLILAVGNFPMHFLTGKGKWVDYFKNNERIRGFTGIQDWRGSILESTLVEGYKVICTYHPAYIIREGMADHGTFKIDLARVAEDMHFRELRWPEKRVICAWQEPQELQNYHDVLRGENPLWVPSSQGETRFELRERLLSSPDTPTTLDIEYIGSKLLCVGLTTSRDSAIVIPTETLGDIMWMQDIVRQTKSFNAQNSLFDAGILEWHYNLEILSRVVFDTMLVQHAANIELPKALDYLVSVYTRQPYYKGMVDWAKVKKGTQPVSIVYAYNGIDVWAQHEVMEEQQRWELCDEDTRRTNEFLMALLQPLWNMSKRGVRIDKELMANISKELAGQAAYEALELMFLAKRSVPINVKSGPQVAALLFDQLGLKPSKMNKTGPATDDKTIAGLSLKATTEDQKQAIKLIRSIRGARDLESKFLSIEFDDDGRMRGSYDPTKTVTGRLASRKFHPTGRGANQQNIPRDKRARRAFIADRGKVFCYADLEKAESLVVAHLTGDPRMLFDHQPGQNAHRNLASALFSKMLGTTLAPEDVDEDQYYMGKQTRHAGNYMQGWMTFMTNINQKAHKTGVAIDAKQAKMFIALYRDLHPGLPRWWDDVKQELYRGRTLYNLLGRKRIFYDHIGSTIPEGVAYIPQSTVGDTLDVGLLNLEGVPCPYTLERGLWDSEYRDIGPELREYGTENLMQIHDAVAFQCFERELDRVIPLVRRAMLVPLTNPRTREDFTIPVEIMADVDPEHLARWVSNWGDAKVIKEH